MDWIGQQDRIGSNQTGSDWIDARNKDSNMFV